jgi:hypothetical protein
MQARKLASIEDLFETQRKELFQRMSEMEKSQTSKYLGAQRNIALIASASNVDLS